MFGGLSLTHLASTTDLLRNYDIGSEIGSGASATVFAVTEKQSKRPYVMKVISTVGLTDEEQRNVQVEVEALKTANHPNIVMHHESDINEHNCVIIMEKCETTLEAVIDSARVHMERSSPTSQQRQQQARGSGKVPPPPPSSAQLLASSSSPFPEDILIEWMAELLSALQYLHKHRIVHRDIKTGNIFISRKNHLKLGDFGVCTILASAPSANTSVDHSPHHGDKSDGTHSGSCSPRGSSQAARTERGAATYSFVGTPFYIAPEVCLGHPWTPQSDVWSLGIVLYELCTLKRPFDGQNVMHLVEAITEGPIPPFPAGHLKDSRFEMIVLSMLNRDPAKRPTVDVLLEKYFVLPASHPSHPQMAPTKAREVQYHHGPKLDFPIIEQMSHAQSETIFNANPLGTVQRGWLTPLNTVQLGKQVSQPLASKRPVPVTKPKELVRPKSAGSGLLPKPATRAKSPVGQTPPARKLTNNNYQPSHARSSIFSQNNAPSAPKPLIARHRDPNAPLQHSENYKQRIRNVKSTVNIHELRKQMMGGGQNTGNQNNEVDELHVPGSASPTPIKGANKSQKRSVDYNYNEESGNRHRSTSVSSENPTRRPSTAPQRRTPSANAANNRVYDELASSGSNVFARTQNNIKPKVDFIATPHGMYEIGQDHPTRVDSSLPDSDAGEGSLGGTNTHYDMNAVYISRTNDLQDSRRTTEESGSPVMRAPSSTNNFGIVKSSSASPLQSPQSAPTIEPVNVVLNALRANADSLSINDLDEIALALNRIRVRRFGVY